jgi:hypothetical protein
LVAATTVVVSYEPGKDGWNMTHMPIGRAPVFLLGAGSVVDAGIPASTAMTKAIVDRVGASHTGDLSLALNFAVGAMIAHDAARGANPYIGVDVERLFAAVQMLASREDSEVAPFVASWAPALDLVGTETQEFARDFGETFTRALTSRFPGDITNVFRQAVLSVLPGHDGGEVYRRLEQDMVCRLRDLTAVDPNKVGYLAPILNTGGGGALRVATLNYDRSVEELALRAGLQVDTGIEAWSGGFDWQWNEDGAVQLLKLHGSIDWHLRQEWGAGALPEPRVEVGQRDMHITDPKKADDGSFRVFRHPPAVVFGQRGKLRAEGPFLAMLRAFDAFLATSDHLIVVGYSFRDDHINSAIARWVNGTQETRLTIVDPAFPPAPAYGLNADGFLPRLRRCMTVQEAKATSAWSWEDDRGVSWRNGFRVVPEKASIGLAQVLGPGPALAPPMYM